MAKILPLVGKYYGTEVGLKTGEVVKVWLGYEPEVSSRELERGWNAEDYGYDHVESATSYKVAQIICDALNKYGF